MTIDLNETELRTIESALDAWEKDATSTALMGMMIGAIACPKDQRDKEESRQKAELSKAEVESQRRKRCSVMLRAKLYQATTAAGVANAPSLK